jgi:hypothetical protein
LKLEGYTFTWYLIFEYVFYYRIPSQGVHICEFRKRANVGVWICGSREIILAITCGVATQLRLVRQTCKHQPRRDRSVIEQIKLALPRNQMESVQKTLIEYYMGRAGAFAELYLCPHSHILPQATCPPTRHSAISSIRLIQVRIYVLFELA